MSSDSSRNRLRALHAARECGATAAAMRWTVFGWALLAGGALAADRIVKVNGTSIDDVEIVRAQWDLVQYQIGSRGRAQSIPGDQVASIEREPDNPVLARGRAALLQGDLEEAESRFKVAMGGGSKDWEKAEAAYRLGEVLVDTDDAEKAATQLKRYLEEHEKSKDWWVPHALYALGAAQVEMKQYESAELSFKKLEDMPEQWKLKAQIGRARAIEGSNNTGKFLEARQLLLSVARGRSTPVELRDEAYVVRGRIFVRQKQYDEAIKELADVFFDPSKSREYRYDVRRAEATCLMGLAHAAKGGKENLEAAELWLLRVPALYPNRGRVYVQSCRALARVYKDLGNDARAAEWLRRGEQ